MLEVNGRCHSGSVSDPFCLGPPLENTLPGMSVFLVGVIVRNLTPGQATVRTVVFWKFGVGDQGFATVAAKVETLNVQRQTSASRYPTDWAAARREFVRHEVLL